MLSTPHYLEVPLLCAGDQVQIPVPKLRLGETAAPPMWAEVVYHPDACGDPAHGPQCTLVATSWGTLHCHAGSHLWTRRASRDATEVAR